MRRHLTLFRLAACALLLVLPANGPPAPLKPGGAHVVVTIDANGSDDWNVSYRADRPVNALAFARSPDNSRGTFWHVPDGFVLTWSPDRGELLRRRDGAAFRAVTVSVPPRYHTIKSEYAPFAPFGDKSGTLVFSGRFFACAERCTAADERAGWPMRLVARDAQSVLFDSETLGPGAAWSDSDSGHLVFVGRAMSKDTGAVIAIVDRALPETLRDVLDESIPNFMHFFSEKLGALGYKPMLFASFDPNDFGGHWGSKGGVLDHEIYVHFYGSHWPQEFAKPDFARNRAWFFAHEVAHLFQRGIVTADPKGWWIHEGGADALAALALRADTSADARAYLDRQIARTRENCLRLMKGQSLHQAAKLTAPDAAYPCGMLIQLAIDTRLRAAHPEGDGLLGLWRALVARHPIDTTITEQEFLDEIAAQGAPTLAEQVTVLLDLPGADFGAL